MNEWLGVIGALTGAAIALLGQFAFRRLELKRDETTLFLEQCAQLVALEEDFRNRIWEERHLGRRDQVAEWSLRDANLATARLRILSADSRLLESIELLNRSGKELGKTWRMKGAEDSELDEVWRVHRGALDSFISTARSVLRRKQR